MRQRRMQAFGGSFGPDPYDDFGEDINPNASLTNLADCMLVLACGLMVALVVAWSVDLPSTTEIVEGEMLTEVDNIEEATDSLNEEGNSYTELGTVYQDPATGKMYMITQDGTVQDTVSSSQTGTSTVPQAGASGGSADSGESSEGSE